MILNKTVPADYIQRVDKALFYIDEHLNEDLPLDKIVTVAGYSSFHFHRIFKLITNEPLLVYVNRKRVERCASLLMHRRDLSAKEIYLEYGFNSASSFSRSFKKYYGLSPVRFRESVTNTNNKIHSSISKNGQRHPVIEKYICSIKEHLNWLSINTKIQIKQIPEMQLAGVTAMGFQNVAGSYDQLVNWAGDQGLLDAPDVKMVTVYHDSAKTTAPDKVRISACILLNKQVEVAGEVSLLQLPSHRCIVAPMEIGLSEFEQAWKGLFIWMQENGHLKAAPSPFEVYHNNYQDHPHKMCIVDLCIPIE
ncbi:hypothetical protein BST86_06480 [Nonlabens agnitus]|uniref:HTH araC/xylS-type domain-containing protein n=1 Tax=Nonlabens agnitus TaxID=870484 RepID=A0A2S9WXX4_9FLAO|nr:hypothetical protein BST86_06480 [Nonlabens agnitus]